jgi:hypothetical protein
LVLIAPFIFLYLSDVSRSDLNRLLQREGLGSLRALRAARAKAAEEKDAAAKKKGFKEYAPGFIHIDIKHLPRMPNKTSRRYLFVAIDRASRWVFLHIYDDQSEESSLTSSNACKPPARFIFARS